MFVRRVTFAALGLLVAAPAAWAAQNNVTNGGFETGNFTGWTLAGSSGAGANGVGTFGTQGFDPHSGNYFAYLGNTGCCATLSQTIADTPGLTLSLSYYLLDDGGTPSSFAAQWDGSTIVGSALTNPAHFGYTQYSFNVVATGTDTLSFASRNDPDFWTLDDISLSPVTKTYSLGGGTATYAGPAPDPLGSTGYDVSTVTPNVNISGVTLTQTNPTHPALVIDQDSDGPLAATFTGAASSVTVTGVEAALDVYHVGPSATGDVSLDTSGTTGGNTFAADKGAGIDVVADNGNAIVTTGADTISSVSGDGLRIDVGNGNGTVTTAANITAGQYGIHANGHNLSVTVAGSVSGTAASIFLDSPGHSNLTLQTGATLVGDAIGSTRAGATNALVLQGHGTTNNNFVNFNTLNVNGDGVWALNGVSSIGATTITTGNLRVGDAAHTSAQLNGTVTIQSGGTLSGHGTVGGAPVGGVTGSVINNGGTISPGGSIGSLTIAGNLQQTGGKIVFEIDPNGTGGFLQSSLVFTPGKTVSISNAEILFDFEDGADPLAFFNGGQFNINSFFKTSNGDLFSSDFNLASVFQGDTFGISAPGVTIDSFTFTPGTGATALTETKGVPEPDSLWLLLPGLGLLAATWRAKRKLQVSILF